MDEKSIEMLEFPKVREILAGFTSFSAGRHLALSLQPSSDAALIHRSLGRSAEARRHPQTRHAGSAKIYEAQRVTSNRRIPKGQIDHRGRTLPASVAPRQLRARLDFASHVSQADPPKVG